MQAIFEIVVPMHTFFDEFGMTWLLSSEKCPTLTMASFFSCFLVGAFSLKEKSPTITVGSFF